MNVIKSQRATQRDKGKISLVKSPKISKHINKKRQLIEHMKTECLNKPIFLICFHEGKW